MASPKSADNNLPDWDAQEIQAQTLLAFNVGANRTTYEELAKQIGISRETLRQWRMNPKFIDEVNRISKEATKADLPDVLDMMVYSARKPDGIADRKLFLQWAGEITGGGAGVKVTTEPGGPTTIELNWPDTGMDDADE